MDEQIDGAGEVIDAGDQGEVALDTQVETTAAPETTEVVAAPPAETTAAVPAKPAEEQFIDPSTLPPELKAHWTRMHGTYNKRLEGIRARQQDIDLVDAYRNNPEFARDFLVKEAQRLGVTLQGAPNGATRPATATPPSAAGEFDPAPPALVARIKARYAREAPELEWMAEKDAAAAWEAIRFNEAPKEQQAKERQIADYRAQFSQEAEKLSGTAPGWEAYDKDMSELAAFIASSALTHPRFGSKLEILHRMVRPDNGTARVAAIRTMGEAARNAARTGQPGRSVTSNVPDRVRKASNQREAIAIAAEEAERELRAQGVAVPD